MGLVAACACVLPRYAEKEHARLFFYIMMNKNVKKS